MPSHLFSYLVPPRSEDEGDAPALGTDIPRNGALFDMLQGLFVKSDLECRTPIAFVPKNGKQENDVRDEVRRFVTTPSLDKGQPLAMRLRRATSQKSGLGLLFLLVGGGANGKEKFVISRFPADEGVLAEPKSSTLDIHFVERVFMKNTASYKAAVYQDKNVNTGFWAGNVVDRQIDSSRDVIAQYWIRDFLRSDFKTTSKFGTKRLAEAIHAALPGLGPEDKEEVVSAVRLARTFEKKSTTVEKFLDGFGLSEQVKEAVIKRLPNAKLSQERFRFDLREFQKRLPLRSVALDNGAVLTAPADRFEECFRIRGLDGAGKHEYTTSGAVIDQKLRRR